jgi:hypothetical protein
MLLVYSISGLPKIVKTMIGEIQLEPTSSGTRLHWKESKTSNTSSRPSAISHQLHHDRTLISES